MEKKPPRTSIRLRFNDQNIELDDVQADATLLDWLRLDQRLTGTKEGCAEGDCGACTVLVGQLENGQLNYRSVNACIRFLPSLDGCHIVTIEHLSAHGRMHPLQQAMVDFHGSQCGFCTPGIIMSLYALWMRNPDYSELDVERALQGNLCRCTGYSPIIRAAMAVNSHNRKDELTAEREHVIAQLTEWRDGSGVAQLDGEKPFLVPASTADLASALNEHQNAIIVSGSTDVGVWVAKEMRDISPAIFIGHLEELSKIDVQEDGVRIGATVSYSNMMPIIEAHFPHLAELWWRIGGDQVRNMGTIGGNIANGSPIGDTPPALIALDAELELTSVRGLRKLKLQDFFLEYGKQDRQPDEFVSSVFLPFPPVDSINACYKISKRRDEDISAVCGAFRLQLAGDVITDARVVFGGMAGTPSRAQNAENALVGKRWIEETACEAMAAMEDDYTPLSDMRASADYRMAVAKNLLMRFWLQSSDQASRLPSAISFSEAAE
jgi:xanthine dehydrogenase small subunit